MYTSVGVLIILGTLPSAGALHWRTKFLKHRSTFSALRHRTTFLKPVFNETPVEDFIRLGMKPKCETFDAKKCYQTDGCLWDSNRCRMFDFLAFDTTPYPRTCSDGHNMAECFDVEKCAEGAPGPTADARWAIVFTHSLQKFFPAGVQDGVGEDGRGLAEETIAPLRDLAKKLGNTDLFLMIPSVDRYGVPIEAKFFSNASRAAVERQGVKVVEVPWVVPPVMKFQASPRWCGPQDLMRLHILGMEDYAAAVYYDTDTQLTGAGDPTVPLRCAAKGHMLTTGGVWGPLNIGFWALKPDRRVLAAAEYFARDNDFAGSNVAEAPGTGWGGAGVAPSKGSFPGSECGQGFVQALFYKNTPAAKKAFELAGVERPSARVIDRCIWNFQSEDDCVEEGPDHFDCKKIVMHHKNGNFCTKPEGGYYHAKL